MSTPNQTPKIQEIRNALNKQFLEREELVDGMLVALITREPLLMIGPPGTAKSDICRAVSNSVGGTFFSWLLSKFTTPEELFGPYSLKGLKEDKYTRVVDGKLPASEVVFLDEVGKASSAISNTLLSIMNERVFFNDGKPQRIPMITLFGASNEVPQGEELGAFYDRFVLRYFVDLLRKDKSVDTLFRGISKAQIPQITLAELKDLQKKSEATPMSDSVVDTLIKLRSEIAKLNIFVSDRKWVQCVRILKGYACLEGAPEVTDDHLDILGNVLWSVPEQRAEVRKILSRMVNPINEKIIEILDGVKSVIDELEKGKTSDVDAYKKVRAAHKELKNLHSSQKPNKKWDQADEEIKKIIKVLAVKHLGFED